MEEEGKLIATCSVCKNPVYDNINSQKLITCARCVQGLLRMSIEEKLKGQDALLEKGDSEGTRSIESFISPEKEVTENEPTRKFRPAVERKRPLRKAWPSHGKNTVRNNRILD
jgi:hypothetical protein